MQMTDTPAPTRFIRDTKRYPVLTQEREREVATWWRNNSDRPALDELVGSHRRLVVKIACRSRRFSGYGLPLSDLVAEGNLGLVRAAQKFEPTRGVRFLTCATRWIRSSMQECILHFWSLVKIGSTSAQKKLFFNLRRLKAKLEEPEQGELPPFSVAIFANRLDVPASEVIEMNRRLGGMHQSLNSPANGGRGTEWLELLPDDRSTQEAVMAEAEVRRWQGALLDAAPEGSREREILDRRWPTDEPATLDELSHRFALSRTPIQQIEGHALSKMIRSVALSPETAKRARSAAMQTCETCGRASDVFALPPDQLG